MLETFYAALTPILTLFICIAAGFTVRKANIVDRSAGKTLSKLVLWIFCPALNFSVMAKNCTTQTLSTHAVNIILGCCADLDCCFDVSTYAFHTLMPLPNRAFL